jgi:SHS2 domain-containing protein
MSVESKASVRFLDHTADVGIEVTGPSLESVIAGAAMAMTRLMLGDAVPPGEEERTLEVTGDEPALLLRNVLRELLFLYSAEGFALGGLDLELEDGESGLKARCRAHGGTPSDPPKTEFKGVTLHGLRAEREDGGWRARVILDV